jgi:hypothetical protein
MNKGERKTNMKLKLLLIAIAVFASSSGVHAGITTGFKEDDVNIGLNTDTNQIALRWIGDTVELPELSGPLFGFGADEPGLISVGVPYLGMQPLPDGIDLVFEVIAFDPALKGWKPGFSGTFHNPGDLWDVGPTPAHEHPFWHIDSTDPAYVPAQGEWLATFRVRDANPNGLLPSDPLTITFTPEPVSGALLALAGVFAMSRRSHWN